MIQAMWWPVMTMLADSLPPARRAEMDPGLLKLAELGKRFTVADYVAAYTERNELHQAMLAFHQRYDLLLTPSMPVTALKVGLETHGGRHLRRRLDRLVALHLSVQPDPAAGGLGAERLGAQRPADGRADRRRAAGRRHGAAGGAGARTGDADATATRCRLNEISQLN